MKEISHTVCLGGGNAMPKTVLAGLKKYPVKISAISAMLDSGGSAGRERMLFKTGVSFGDLRRAALALSEAPATYKDYLSQRYQSGFLEGHVPINIYCTTSAITSGMGELLRDLQEDFKIPRQYQLLPVTIDNSTLCAELENGKIIRGEGNIDVPKHDGNLKIKKVFLEPEAMAYPAALKAIEEAHLIVIGPGDLYSSLSQILLVKGIAEAIRKSRAKKIYICSLMTKFGETNNFSVLDFTFEIERYLGGEVNRVIYNRQIPSPKILVAFKKEHEELIEPVKFYEILNKEKFIGADLIADGDQVVHDPDKLAQLILDPVRSPSQKKL